MSAVLRAYGDDFDVDTFLSTRPVLDRAAGQLFAARPSIWYPSSP